jgi:hypothetical protein
MFQKDYNFLKKVLIFRFLTAIVTVRSYNRSIMIINNQETTMNGHGQKRKIHCKIA